MTTRQEAISTFNDAMTELSSGAYANSGLDNALYEAVGSFSERLPLENPQLTLEEYNTQIVAFIEAKSSKLQAEAEAKFEADFMKNRTYDADRAWDRGPRR